MKWLLPLLWPSFGSAEIVETTLTLTPATQSENSLALGLSVGAVSSSDTSLTSGTVTARIDIDADSGEISSLELLSGEISATAVNLVGKIFGFTTYDVSTSILGATVLTPSGPAPVANGQSPSELHQITINEGTLNGDALGSAIPEQNFGDMPVSGNGTAGTFVGLSSTLNPADTTTGSLFDLNFTFPVNITQVIDFDEISATVTATGNIRATGLAKFTVTPPNLYRTWATGNRRAEAAFAANDFSNLLPNGLLWALGYEGEDIPSLLSPIDDGSGAFSLDLPEGGTAAEVSVQVSSNLSDPDGWSTIATIPAGTTATQSPLGGGGGPAFLRLLTENPTEQ